MRVTVRVSISSKDGVIICADRIKNHLQAPKKVPGLKVGVRAQQRNCSDISLETTLYQLGA